MNEIIRVDPSRWQQKRYQKVGTEPAKVIVLPQKGTVQKTEAGATAGQTPSTPIDRTNSMGAGANGYYGH
jgi:hypothetical protein